MHESWLSPLMVAQGAVASLTRFDCMTSTTIVMRGSPLCWLARGSMRRMWASGAAIERAAVSTPIASAISAWTSARCLLWKRVMVLSRLSLDDLDDRGEETESNSVAILELVARARVEAHAVDESPIGAAGVFELDASRAGC